MGNENYKDIERRYEELKERFPDIIRNERDSQNIVTVYIDPKKMFSRKERKDIEFAIKIVSEGRIHAF